MCPQLVFRKVTPDGLLVEIRDFEGQPLLLLTQQKPSPGGRPIQVMGIATEEQLAMGGNWYYEYMPLPRSISTHKMKSWLEMHGYVLGVFDQFGNFRQAA